MIEEIPSITDIITFLNLAITLIYPKVIIPALALMIFVMDARTNKSSIVQISISTLV